MKALDLTYEKLMGLVRLAPTPWYLDQNNDNGVCVKDSRGETIFFDDFGSIPDEMPSGEAAKIRARSVALAHFLTAMSDTFSDQLS